MPDPASWYPDPSGRHEHRYWDGTAWTADVSDRGVVSRDPIPQAAPVPAAPPGAGAPYPGGGAPTAGAPYPGGAAGWGAPQPAKRSKVPLVSVLAALVAVVVIIGVVVLVGGDDDDGGGGGGSAIGVDTYDGEVTGDDPIVVFDRDIPIGTVYRVSLRPEEGFDAVLGIAVSDPSIEDLSALEGDFTDFNSEFISDDGDPDDAPDDLADLTFVARTDLGGSGENERTLDFAYVGGRYTFAVRGSDGDEGRFELVVEVTEAPAGRYTSDDFDDEDFFSDLFSDDDFNDFVSDFVSDDSFFSTGFGDEDDSSDDFSDFSSDFSDFSDSTDDFSDFSSDFSDFSDFSDDFSDFSSDFSDDFSDFSSDFSEGS
jgi:hypothetical protein